MCSIVQLLCLPPVEDSLLPHLLPFDIARLFAATGCDIKAHSEKWYMNPIRDVFENPEDIELLTRAGARIILLGHNAQLLHSRLKNPDKFIRDYGNDFPIDLIAIAYCHPESAANAPYFSRSSVHEVHCD